MSENTNTLFWVITGAVIVLAVFLIVNESQNNTLNNIFTKFSEIYANQNNDPLDDNYSEYFNDESFEKNNYTEIHTCGLKTEIVEGYKVGIHDVYDTGDDVVIRWLIINTNEIVRNGRIYVAFFNCETNKLITQIHWDLNNIQPNDPIILSSSNITAKDFQYYIDVNVRFY